MSCEIQFIPTLQFDEITRCNSLDLGITIYREWVFFRMVKFELRYRCAVNLTSCQLRLHTALLKDLRRLLLDEVPL